MQTIWTRAAQFGSACRCPQCASSIQGVSRRTTASATRRMPRYLTTSTLLYSGIFAAATTYDAKSKRERRDQWDHAIADIKEELDQPRGIRNKATERGGKMSKEESMLPEFGPDSQLNEFGSVLDSTMYSRHHHWAPRSTAGQLEAKYLAPQSLYAPGYRKRQHLGRPWTEMKLERVRLCMDKFQLDIMEELQKSGLSQDAARHVPFAYGQHILSSSSTRRARSILKLHDIARLRKEDDKALLGWKRSDADVPLNAYQMDEAGHFVERTRHLNQTLQILFRRRARGKITRAELLAKVSYNLSASPTPPSVDTFNALIVGFAHLQEKHLYKCTTVALSHTRVRPNEVTLASIFKYDAESRDFTHFCTWLRRLRGLDGGLYAARGDIAINDVNRARLIARSDSNSGAIIQLPAPTPMVFNALVSGMLNFFGFDTALRVCRDMGEEGWGMSLAGLQVLLEDCAHRGDWKPGVAVWDRIQTLKAKSHKRYRCNWDWKDRRWVWISEKIQLPTYIAMLKLCRKCSQRETFEDIVTEAAKEHHMKLPQLVQLMREEGRLGVRPRFQEPERRDETSNAQERLRGRVRRALPQDKTPSEPLEQKFSPSRSSSFTDLTIREEQLHGVVPGNQYLDQYELYERPISM